MIEIRRSGSDDWSTVRAVRLAALLDSPDYFWATHEEEVPQPEPWWREFIGAGAWFIAFDAERPIGIAAVLRTNDVEDSARQLISMWVEPGARRRGAGVRLIDAVTDWARADGARVLQLQVTEGNDAARRLYERCGFRATGRTEALPRDRSLIEHEMRLVL